MQERCISSGFGVFTGLDGGWPILARISINFEGAPSKLRLGGVFVDRAPTVLESDLDTGGRWAYGFRAELEI
jgi:hypothetical protein